MSATTASALSPDFIWILTLLLRMAITAAFVVGATFITERTGPVIGALVAALPVSAGPSYLFLALDHDAAFVAQSALASLPINAATIYLALTYVLLAERFSMTVSLAGGVVVWSVLAVLARQFEWTVMAGVIANVVTFAICLPLMQRYRHVQMPLITRRWYDVPLRAGLVSALVVTVVIVSGRVGPQISGTIALYPIVLTSLILILHPRIGGGPTAAVIANSGWGLMGFGLAIATLPVVALQSGVATALLVALAVCIGWNLTLWQYSRWRQRRSAGV